MIFQCIEFNEKEQRRIANVASFTEARGWCGLFNGFAGKNTKKASPIDFLPYPDEFKVSDKISLKTARILIDVVKSGAMNPRHVGALSEVLNEAMELLKK